MKIELLSRTDIYSFTHDEEDYTVHIDESDSFFNHEIVDKDGNQIEGDHYDYLIKGFWSAHSSVSTF
jgi:hypothetical protein